MPNQAAPQPCATPLELARTWVFCIAGIAVAKALSLVEPSGTLAANLAGVAAVLFIALPDRKLQQRGESWDLYGLPWWGIRDPRTWQTWGRGFGLGLCVCALLFPPFLAVFCGFGELIARLPAGVAGWLGPYAGHPSFHFRLPVRFPMMVLTQFLVVALPEEMFYRGWMQTSWAAAGPAGRMRVLGASVGSGFWATQLLFASGHLVDLQIWRLGTFFPGLVFGWLRARTGNITASVAVHAMSNLFMAVLEASFYQ